MQKLFLIAFVFLLFSCQSEVCDCADQWLEMTQALKEAEAEGKPVDSAWQISPEQVSTFLSTLPADHFHCAELAVGALYLALADLTSRQH